MYEKKRGHENEREQMGDWRKGEMMQFIMISFKSFKC